MSDMEMVALMMLRAAAELYNDAEILRDAIEGDEHDQFSTDLINGEWEFMQDAARKLISKIDELLDAFAGKVVK